MACQVHADDLFFKGQLRLLVILAHIRQGNVKFLFLLLIHKVKEGHLSGHGVFFLLVHLVQDLHVDGHELPSRAAQAVKGSRLDKVLDGAPVHILSGHPLDEILQAAEESVLSSLLDNGVDHRLPDALDGCQAVPDIASVHGEISLSLVDVGRQDGNPHLTAAVNIFCHLRWIFYHGCHEGRHKFHRIVVFQISRLIGHYRVGRCVGLIKSIFCKIDHLVVDLVGRLFVYAVVHAARHALLRVAVDKILPLPLHHIALFLGHGAAQKVAAPQRVAGQVPDDLHDLLLVDDAPVCGSQDGLQLRAVVGDELRVVFPLDVLGDKVHGARAVQGDPGNDVLQALRLQLLHEALHPGTLKLEDAVRLSGPNGIQHRFVIVINAVYVDFLPRAPAGQLHRVLDHSQGPKTQEIHLQKPQFLQGSHGELGGHRAVRPEGERHVLVHRLLADDHAGGVHGGVPGQSLQPLGHVNELPHLVIFLVQFFQLRVHGQCLVQGDVQLCGDHLCDSVHKGVGQVHDPPHVPQDAPGCQGTEGDDLHHPVRAVLAHHIVDDFLPPLKAEVHVNIRHGHTLRVEEPLKEELVPDGVNAGDAQAVGHNAAGGGAPPGSHHDTVVPGVFDKVPHNEEIVHVAHVVDDGQLVLQPLLQLLGDRAVPLLQPLVAEFI